MYLINFKNFFAQTDFFLQKLFATAQYLTISHHPIMLKNSSTRKNFLTRMGVLVAGMFAFRSEAALKPLECESHGKCESLPIKVKPADKTVQRANS